MNKLARAGGTVRWIGLGAAAVALVGSIILMAGVAAVRLAHHVAGLLQIAGIAVVGGLVVGVVGARLSRRVRRHTVLELALTTLPPENAGDNPLAPLTGGGSLTLRDTIETLEKAAADKRVDGLLLHATFSQGGMAQLQELRDAIIAFRAAGKFATAFNDDFTNASYYLASACDQVLLQPGSSVFFTGLGRDVNFLRGALDKLDIQFQAEGRWEYKNAANQLLETAFTPAHREATTRLMEATFDQLVDGVAEQRHLDPSAVRAAAEVAPLLGQEVVDRGFVDAFAYRDQAIARAKESAGGGAGRLMLLSAYKRRARRIRGKGKPVTVGLVTATGLMVSRRDESPVPGVPLMEADKISEAIRKASNDKRVKAIVLRVDSGGGSAIASETIWRETVRAREAGKPFVVSMGNAAASGGYYIASAADRIVAQPGTVTGSIGAISGKPVIGRAKHRLGINVEAVQTSANALFASLNRPFSESELERFRASLDDAYDLFTSRVADGRRLDPEHVQAVARGRVWIASDAKERGLVDELGGLRTATRIAGDLAGFDAGAAVRIKTFPKKASALGRVRGGKPHSSDDERAQATLATLLALLAPLADGLRQLGLAGDRGALHCGLDERDWMVR